MRTVQGQNHRLLEGAEGNLCRDGVESGEHVGRQWATLDDGHGFLDLGGRLGTNEDGVGGTRDISERATS
jgi:hypothetical protein